jgi:hypothetical protein
MGKKKCFNLLGLIFNICTNFSISALPKANESNADRRLRAWERITVALCARLCVLTLSCHLWTVHTLQLSMTWDADHNQFRNICEFPQTLSSATRKHI